MRRRIRARRGMTTGQIIALVAVIAVVLIGCLAAGLVALMLPALAKARTTAQALRSSAQMRMVVQSAETRARDTSETGVFAIPVDALIADQYFTAEMLESPFGDAPGGGPDYWTLPGEIERAAVDDPTRFVVMYDRAMYTNHGSVAVAHLDGTVELLEPAAFRRLLETPPNEGRDFDLPGGD